MASCSSCYYVFDSRRRYCLFIVLNICIQASLPKGSCSPALQLQPVPVSDSVVASDDAIKDLLPDNAKHQLIMAELIPSHYKITVILAVSPEQLGSDLVLKLRQALADQLDLPLKNVGISSVKPEEGAVEVYFVYVMAEDVASGQGDLAVLLPASHVVRLLSTRKLESYLKPVSVLAIDTEYTTPQSSSLESSSMRVVSVREDMRLWSLFRHHIWSSWQLPLLLTSCLFAVFAMALLLMFLCYCRDIRKKGVIEATCVSPVESEIRHIVYQPILKPAIRDADPIQPESRDSCYLTETESEHTPSPVRSPLKFKPRGLLESSSMEILLSVGNRLTRKQLRTCLRDVKALHTEFWEIPMNHPEKSEIPGCGTKNRYRTILPNENTRVRLSDNQGDLLNSYINANYIRGYDGEHRAYIATQGPLPHTVADFWHMVWKERAPIIVMITKLKEKNKVKCESYLPVYRDFYGSFDVSIVKILQRDGYTITELFLKRGDEAHQVLHFWYTSWPDHKTPTTSKQLVEMALEVENLRHHNDGNTKGPTIVHCSAGIGRTGCFLATSIGIQQLLEEKVVDILGIVCSLRLDRGGMVQTAEQYEFVHQALCLFERTLLPSEGE